MSTSGLITAAVALAAIGGGGYAMLCGATPYMTVAQARASQGDRLNLVGDIVRESIRRDPLTHHLTFVLRDPEGAQITVRYTGEPVANLPAANRIVALGRVQGNEFLSDKMLIKCPSKYEEARKVTSVAQR